MEAILTATQYAAEALGQEKNMGTIAEGKSANIVILNKNPLEDIHAIREIHSVIKDGKILKRGKLLRDTKSPDF